MDVIKAYAKINLRLKVVGKNESNYHLLQMINAKVDLYDEIIVNADSENKVIFDIDELNHIDNNICLNTLNDFCAIYNIKSRYNIYIKKNIPSGAGLGGGSCDVACILNYLNEVNNLNVSYQDLSAFSLKYGSDIPYCLRSDICLVEGIGEKISCLDVKLNEKILLVYPNIFSSTKEVYKNVDGVSLKDSITELKEYIYNKNYSSLFYNDLESAAFKLNPELKNIKEELSKYGKVIMSGSGSTFIVVPTNDLCKDELLEKRNIYKIFDCNII